MANILKQIKIGNTTYDIEPVTAYLPLGGGTMNGPLNFKNNTWNTVGDDVYIGDYNEAGSLGIKGANGQTNIGFVNQGNNYYLKLASPGVTANRTITMPDKDGTMALTNDIPTSLPANGGNADTVDGDHSSAFARVASHNDLTASGNEFTFASSGYSGPIYLNWRTAGGTNGNITEYILGNGAGASLGTIIHTGNIGSQNVNYANSAGYASSSHLLRTYNSEDGSHGADYYLKCKHNVDGNGRFKLQIVRNDGSVTHSTSVDFATSAGSVAWGNIGGKPSTFPTTVDSSLSSSSSNPVKNSAIYSAFSSAVGFDHDKYSYGESGSWRLREYHSTGNSLDIRYGKVAINAQEKTYSVSFGENKSFDNNTYAVVCGIYRDNRNSWFWSPLVTKRSPTGFNVYVKGNTSGDNSGTLMYIAIRSN